MHLRPSLYLRDSATLVVVENKVKSILFSPSGASTTFMATSAAATGKAETYFPCKYLECTF